MNNVIKLYAKESPIISNLDYIKGAMTDHAARGYETFAQLPESIKKELTIDALQNLFYEDIDLLYDWLNVYEDKHLMTLILRSMADDGANSKKVIEAFIEKGLCAAQDYMSDMFYECARDYKNEIDNFHPSDFFEED